MLLLEPLLLSGYTKLQVLINIWKYALLQELLLPPGYQKHLVLIKYCNMRSYRSFFYFLVIRNIRYLWILLIYALHGAFATLWLPDTSGIKEILKCVLLLELLLLSGYQIHQVFVNSFNMRSYRSVTRNIR